MNFFPAKNKAIFCFILFFTGLRLAAFSQVYISTVQKISFFSSTPIEDIRAISNKGNSVIVSQNRQVAFQVPVKSFQFERKLMQQHFNEEYLESDKYPTATFKGTINEAIDFTKDGEYPVTVSGKLLIHGLSRDRTIKGLIKVKNSKIDLSSQFDVSCKDHDIKIPSLMFTKIAQVIQVKVNAQYILNP